MKNTEFYGILRSSVSEATDFTYHRYMPTLDDVSCILEAAKDPTYLDLSTVSTWPQEFLLSDGENYESTLALLKDDPNSTTLAILDELGRVLGAIAAKNWLVESTLEIAERVRTGSMYHMLSSEMDLDDFGHMEIVFDFFRVGMKGLKLDRRWRSVSDKVGRFCLRAGSARVVRNPFQNIEALRETILQRPGRETELLAEIKLLKEKLDANDEELKQQRRIIEDLSYRHIMENIIDPQKWTGNYASDWRTFWDDAVNNATSVPNRAPRKANSPIVGLINQFGQGSIGSIKGTGGAMYGTLSTNIHHCGNATDGVYKLQSQRDKMPEEIMKALAPLSTNVQNNKVDWTAERNRFI